MNRVEPDRLTSLRKQAENIVQEQVCNIQGLSDKDIQSLIHELQVHQIELEMQNEELRRTQEELEEARNRYAELYDFAPVGYFTFDKNGIILEVNLTGSSMLGMGRGSLVKQPFTVFVAPESADIFYKHLRQALGTGSRQTCEIKLKDKKGTQRDAWLESMSVHDSKGRFIQYRTVVIDITEKKKLEEQLFRAQRLESIGRLASGIAHDFNNMLTPIMLSLQMLKQQFKDEQIQKLLAILESSSIRGANLTKQIMLFARGSEGERNILQVTHLLSEFMNILRQTFPKNIEIQTDIPQAVGFIYADATQMNQVLMNLCVNARDAMPDGGILKLSAENVLLTENNAKVNTDARVGPYVVITVSDTGKGIPPEIMDKIFDPFFTTKDFGKGTGLGLSIALGIVKSHGGFINVSSGAGKGATFKVYLPNVKKEIR